jgi:hypothetical protein
MRINSFIKILSIILFILCLITYFISPADRYMVLENITNLYTRLVINQTSSLVDLTINEALTNTSQVPTPQIPETPLAGPSTHDVFYGVSRAVPGRFQIILRR